ncbi:MAG: hypothetical protein ACK2UQ_18980, partial [Anaerolineae bacterium]
MKTTHYMCTHRMCAHHAWFVWVALVILLMLSACRQKPLLENVSVAPDTITPNADGETDLARITFTLNRNATVSIILSDVRGQTYIFRAPRPLSLNDKPYTVYFGGVVDGFTLPEENPYDFSIVKRMLPDGVYTWEIKAVSDDASDDGEVAATTGSLTI